MGNLCGKESKPSPFDQPGRTVGSAPPPSTDGRAPAPKISSQGRPLGSNGGSHGVSDARQAAAKAAEVRSIDCSAPIRIRRPATVDGLF